MLKTDTDIYEPPVKEFLQMSIQSMQQNDSHNSSTLKQHFFSRSRAVTVLLANEIQLPDTTLKPNELAFEQPDNFQTIVSNFTTIPIETNISPQPVPIPQDPEIKSVRTLHTMKS
jgi:hypothetical protein